MEDWSILLFLLEYLYETVDIDRKAYGEGATSGHCRTPIIFIGSIAKEVVDIEIHVYGIKQSLLKGELPYLIAAVVLLDIGIWCREIATRKGCIQAIERAELAVVVDAPCG